MKLPTGQLFVSRDVPMTLNEQGRKKIMDEVMRQARVNLYDHPYRYKIQWTPVVQRGEYRGTLAKRISAIVHEQEGKDLSPALLRDIGNLAAIHSSKIDSLIFDFVSPPFLWSHSDFGQGEYGGSCYFRSQHPEALATLEHYGAYAMRSFAVREGAVAGESANVPYDGHVGTGRVWLMDMSYQPNLEGSWLMFNTYGPDIADFAAVFSSWLGEYEWRIVNAFNSPDSGSSIYMNGQTGALIHKGPSDVRNVDLKLEIVRAPTCHECGFLSRGGAMVDGYNYCAKCVDKYTHICVDGLRHQTSRCIDMQDGKYIWTFDRDGMGLVVTDPMTLSMVYRDKAVHVKNLGYVVESERYDFIKRCPACGMLYIRRCCE